MDYLTDHPENIRLQNCMSDPMVCSTGALQQTVLSLFLFILFTVPQTFLPSSKVL